MKANSDELTWKNVGAYLKNLRYEEKKSQVDFAAEWGISERTLRMLEEGAGHVSSDTLLAMARKKGDIVLSGSFVVGGFVGLLSFFGSYKLIKKAKIRKRKKLREK